MRLNIEETRSVDNTAEKARFYVGDDELASETFKAATAGKLFSLKALGEARRARRLAAMNLVGILAILLYLWLS